ncbi:MAG: DUF523 domain-containing protein [Deltaproteobacteria bacterium]|nr:DUF523 domain-containing protein [Deltaproteobacteria bacterium]
MLISACLLGIRSRYDGSHALSPKAMRAIKGRCVIPVCPEQLGGLPTPRPKACIQGGTGVDVLDGRALAADENGTDVTGYFIKGATETLRIAALTGADEALLKEKSPSCGVSFIKKGRRAIKGRGVCAAMLEKNGIKIKGV